jgi:predicted dehydrogenase
VAVCDLDEARARSVIGRRSTVAVETSLERLLEREDVDAIAVATPARTHSDITMAALSAGKHVLVEKPIADSRGDAMRMIEAARERDLVLMADHTYCYTSVVTKIAELIADGVLGEILFIDSVRINLGLVQPDVDVFWDLAPHDLSILSFWLEQMPVEISAMTRNCVLPHTPDVAFVNMRYDSGTIAHLELSWLSPVKLRRTSIVGSNKMVVYDDTSKEPIRIFDAGAELPPPETFGEFRLAYRTGDIVSPKVEATEPLALEVADFCSAIIDGVEPRSSAQLGYELVCTIEAIERSLATGSERLGPETRDGHRPHVADQAAYR